MWELDVAAMSGQQQQQGGSGAAGGRPATAAAMSDMLGMLAQELGAVGRVQPGVNCGGVFCVPQRPQLPPPGK